MAADERPISDFPRLTSILTTALLFTSVVSGVDSYDSRSVTTEVLARAMLGDFQYSDIDAQTVFDRINQIKVLSDTAAPSAAVGAENQIFVQIDDTGLTDVIEAIFVKYSGAWLEVPYQKSSDNNLQTTDKTIVGAINELHAINGYSYDAYDDTATYSVGDLCIYNNTLYKCTTAITTAEAWNANHWAQTSIADEISRIDTALSGKADYNEVTTPTLNNQFIDISDSWFYVRKIGNFCYINGRLKLTATVSNNYGLVFNMPLATGNSLMMVFVSGRDFNNKANTFIVSCVVSNGTLTIQTYPDNIESGKYLYINGFYTCQ